MLTNKGEKHGFGLSFSVKTSMNGLEGRGKKEFHNNKPGQKEIRREG